MKDAIIVTVITLALVTGACCGIVGGAMGMVATAALVHNIVD